VVRTTLRTTAAFLVLGAVISGGTMAVALIVDRDHYPTDTIGGFCIAVAAVLVSALAIEWWAERPVRPRS
jgi:undecaprenyl-diphosphatase